MKIKKLKYIFGVVFGLLFVGYCFAGPDVSSTSSCQSQNYSTNPANNSGNVNNPDWYYNSSEGMIWWHNVHPSSTSIQGNISDIIGYKLTLLKKFDGAAGYSSPSSVWHLQNVLKDISTCTTVNRDCKLGTDTNASFFSCNICKGIDSSYEEPESLTSSTSIVCRDGYEKVTEGQGANLCCKELPYSPGVPVINTNPQWEGGVAHVVIQYTDDANVVDHWDRNANVFHVSVGTIDNLNINESSMSVTFDVKDIPDDVRSLDVSVGEGLIIFQGDISSLGGSNTFSYEITCPNPPDSNGACQQGYVLGDGGCCEESACSNPPSEDGTCSQQGYVVGAGGCCEPSQPCTGNQYQTEGGCQACTGDTIPNSDRTKCVCDPNKKCCGIQLNTVVPFIGDCIEMSASTRGDTTSVTSTTAFPILMQGLMKILMSAIMVFSFLMVIVAGLSMTTGAFGGSGFTKGKTILKNVIISLILLGCSGLILSLVNPSFFGR